MSTAAAVPRTQHAGVDRALHVPRAHHALAHRLHVSLLPGHRPRLLLAASVLARVSCWAERRRRASGIPSLAFGFVMGTLWMNNLWRRDMEITEVDKRWLDKTASLRHQ